MLHAAYAPRENRYGQLWFQGRCKASVRGSHSLISCLEMVLHSRLPGCIIALDDHPQITTVSIVALAVLP